MDGSDDSYEAFQNWSLFAALGGGADLHQRARFLWEGVTRQFTQYGQIWREFDAFYDWMHHGESSTGFYAMGLADASDQTARARAQRFAHMYMGLDPLAPNWDSERRMMRSPITGSKGPRLVNEWDDWSTHRAILAHYPAPFEDIPGVDGPIADWNDDRVYSEILKLLNERQMHGDVPLNLTSTSLVTHAYIWTGDTRYKQWVLDYLEAWADRIAANDGLCPDNIGPNGKIGELMGGKWWGGYYGWRWPHGAMTLLEPLTVSGTNAVMLTGEMGHLDLLRSQLDMLWSLRRDELIPNRHYDAGWRDFRHPHPMFGVYLWNISMDEADAARAERGWALELFDRVNPNYSSYGQVTAGGHMGFNGNTAQWFRFIRGQWPEYP